MIRVTFILSMLLLGWFILNNQRVIEPLPAWLQPKVCPPEQVLLTERNVCAKSNNAWWRAIF